MARPKIRPDVFLHAAELIDSGQTRFSCWAIENAARAAGVGSEDYRAAFHAAFYSEELHVDARGPGGPYFSPTYIDSFGSRRIDLNAPDAAPRSHRAFALLLCYELARRAQFARKRQYRRLKIGDVIRKGDEWQNRITGEWRPSKVTIGDTVGGGIYRRRVRTKAKEGLL